MHPRTCTALLVLLCLSLPGMLACAGRGLTPSGEQAPKLTSTTYYQAGSTLFFSVDVRAARIARAPDYLPLYITLLNNLNHGPPLRLGRESFVLELPDGRRMALATYSEYEELYTRWRRDLRLAEPHVEVLRTRFPEPPYRWMPLDFFPMIASGTFPRDDIELHPQHLALGYLYFKLPENRPADGAYRLLLTPQQSDTTYVLDFHPFKEGSRSRR